MANFADLGCIFGQLVPRDASSDWQAAGAVARSGCGASARLRQSIVEAQARAGRQGGSIQPRQDNNEFRDPDAPPQAAYPQSETSRIPRYYSNN